VGTALRVAVCGGVYSNPHALRAFLADAAGRGAERLYCLGDLGGYGAEPEAVWPLLTSHHVECIAGNYDVAIAAGQPDCGCGYRDPRDREYAQVMYEFTVKNTSASFASWMSGLATERREALGGAQVHFVHGSPAGLNDFWWESLPDTAHVARVAESGADVIFCTHSGLPWARRFGDTLAVNVGVLGRPPNDGSLDVRYALADFSGGGAHVDIVRLPYDWRAQANSMRAAGLPDAFTHTNETGWWATCLEVLPNQERSRGRYHVYDSSVPALLETAGLPADGWPGSDPAIPVRSLYNSPLLPSHIWLAGVPATADLAASAVAAGVTQIMIVGQDPAPAVRSLTGPQSLLVPELTLSTGGWHWHPAMLDAPPFLPASHGDGQPGGPAVASVKSARTAAVQRLLEHFQLSGALSPPVQCAG
jgi:hypothetical protein